MTQDHTEMGCRTKCLIASIVLGVIVAILLKAVFGLGLIWALLLGIGTYFLLMYLLPTRFCSDAPVSGSSTSAAAPAPSAPSKAAAPAAAAVTPAASASAPTAAAPTVDAAVTAKVAPAEPAAATQAEAKTAPAEKSPPKAAPAKKAQAKKAPADKAAAKKATAAKKAPAKDTAAAAPAPEAGGTGSKPATLSAAREGGPDDLKMIKGVGPKLESLLHEMGFYHYDQIANLSAAEVAWVDENLQGVNKGRVSRDDWVAQARLLADGGETEFSKRAAKDGIYK